MKKKKPFDGKMYVKHGSSDTPRLAREYLLDLGCKENTIDKLFDKKGNWKYKVERRFDPFNYSAKQLEKTLLTDLAPVYDLVNESLDGIYEHGFNKHDLDHIRDVTSECRKIMEESSADQRTKIIGVIASVAHDLGNILSRKSHSLLSPMLFRQIFPNMQVGKQDWIRIKNAIRYHDEPVIEEEINSWKVKTPIQKIEMFREVFEQETLALLVADKTRVSRERLSDKPKTKRAVDENVHVEVNLLGQTESLVVKKDHATVTFHYRPFANAEEAKKYPHFFQKIKYGSGFRASVSRDTQKLHEFETPIDHFSVWRHQYWKIYAERTILYVYCLFALFPHIDFVKIKMVDFISPASKSFEEVEYVIDKEELLNFERFVRVKYLKKT
ncbi:hypothetical protein ACFL2C_02220 [Patescibacteria group bacterium]